MSGFRHLKANMKMSYNSFGRTETLVRSTSVPYFGSLLHEDKSRRNLKLLICNLDFSLRLPWH